jgi:hypothetical protein
MNLVFKNKTYDVLKYIAQVVLPALGTLYFALAASEILIESSVASVDSTVVHVVTSAVVHVVTSAVVHVVASAVVHVAASTPLASSANANAIVQNKNAPTRRTENFFIFVK